MNSYVGTGAGNIDNPYGLDFTKCSRCEGKGYYGDPEAIEKAKKTGSRDGVTTCAHAEYIRSVLTAAGALVTEYDAPPVAAPLSDNHSEMLRLLSASCQGLRGYRSIAEEIDLRALGFSKAQARDRVPGLLIPVHGTDGLQLYSVYRPDFPRVTRGQVVEFEVPAGYGLRLDCPPAARRFLANPDVPLWVTDSPIKADALASLDQAVIAMLGAWGYKGKNKNGGITWLNDWEYVGLPGREIRLVIDSATMSQSSRHFVDHLERRKAQVVRAALPLGGDLLAYLAAHSLTDLEAIIERPNAPIKESAPKLLEEPPIAMRRPLALIGDRAYAAIWPYLQIEEERNADGELVRLDQARPEQQLLIVRDDGVLFGEYGKDDTPDWLPMHRLGVKVSLSDIPHSDRLWSTRSIRKFQEGYRPEPATVFNRMADVIDRFMDFDRSFGDQRVMAEMCAAYALATWFLDAFNVIGYLWANGGYGSGKTQLITAIAQMSHLGIVILSGSSMPALRDLADYGGTLAFDDAETIASSKQGSDQDKRTLLLAGNRRGNYITIKDPLPGGGGWRTRHVTTYCPRLFSAIKLPDETLASRTILVPLLRSSNPEKANADVANLNLWPHSLDQIIDDCWILSLVHLADLRQADQEIPSKTKLLGRLFEPWRAILAVAYWLDAGGVKGLWKRMEALSLAYQGERSESDSDDLTNTLIRAIYNLVLDELKLRQADTTDTSDTSFRDTMIHLRTKLITDEVHRIIESEEIPIDPDRLTSDRIGRILRRLRFQKARLGKEQARAWAITLTEARKYFLRFGLTLPS